MLKRFSVEKKAKEKFHKFFGDENKSFFGKERKVSNLKEKFNWTKTEMKLKFLVLDVSWVFDKALAERSSWREFSSFVGGFFFLSPTVHLVLLVSNKKKKFSRVFRLRTFRESLLKLIRKSVLGLWFVTRNYFSSWVFETQLRSNFHSQMWKL